MKDYTILLPPSEGKISGGDENKPYRLVENLKKYNSFTSLINPRSHLYEQLLYAVNHYSWEEVEKIFEVKGKNLDYVIDIVQDMLNLPTMPAINRFSGVMFKAIDYDSMKEVQRNNFETKVLFVDGLFGVLRPQDYIPEYKLKITSKIGEINCTHYWQKELGGLFNYLFKDKVIIDMLPQTHRKVLSLPINCTYFKIIFAKIKDGKFKEEGHNSKKLKGELIRYITQKDTISREYLEKFVHSSGHKYSSDYSDENTITYLN